MTARAPAAIATSADGDSGVASHTTRVVVDAKGFIAVDGQRRTAEANIFAVGDVAGEPMLAHKASAQGRVAVEVVHGGPAVFEPLAIPAVVFTDPEVAWAGLTETEAQRIGRKVEIAKFPWAALGRAPVRRRRWSLWWPYSGRRWAWQPAAPWGSARSR